MTEKIGIGISDETSPGLNSIEKNLGEVEQAAEGTEKQLNETAAAADNLGNEGKKAGKDTGLALTELNQGLEILKKGFELTSRAVQALAADGSPAFLRLQESVNNLHGSLLDLGSDPGIQEFVDTIADGINQKVIPAINSFPDYWRSAQNSVADFTATAGEAIGVFADGTVEALQEIQVEEEKLLKKRQEQLEIERQREAVEGRIGKLSKMIAEQDQLQQLAQIKDRNTVLYLIDEETERLRKLAKEGRATRDEQDGSLKKIAMLKKRELEIPREQAEAEQRAMEEAAKAAEKLAADRQKAAEDAAKAEEDYQRKLQASVDAAVKARESEMQAMLNELEKKKQELVSLIEKAQSGDGKSSLDSARQNMDPAKVRAELVRKAQEEARANWTSPDDDASKAGARREAAARQAGINAFRDFNAGKTSEADIAGAQNALINNQAQAAVGRGQIDQQTASALMQAAQNQQQIIQTQQQQAQQMQQINAILVSTGGAARNTNAQARRNLYGR